jgi:hypothetical protein
MAGVLVLGGGVEAAPIHHADLSEADARLNKEWSDYLQHGPKFWERVLHPPVTRAVESLIWKDVKTDPGEPDPMVRFLLWKQSLDPTRFAYYHPKLAPALHKIARSAPTAPQLLGPPPASSSSGALPPAEGNSSGCSPSPVPEPSTLLLALGMAGWGIWRARRRKANL